MSSQEPYTHMLTYIHKTCGSLTYTHVHVHIHAYTKYPRSFAQMHVQIDTEKHMYAM